MKDLLNKELMEKLKGSMSKRRFEHSQSVCATAVEMAERFGADCDKAWLAGMLHDCAKGMSTAEQITKCGEYGIFLDEITLVCSPVIHAPLGAEIARRIYGVEDKEVLDAIRKHTVGGCNMSLLDKIIYTADMIEPNRSFNGVEELRQVAKNDINQAYLKCIKQSLLFNINENKIIHPSTLDSYNELICLSL